MSDFSVMLDAMLERFDRQRLKRDDSYAEARAAVLGYVAALEAECNEWATKALNRQQTIEAAHARIARLEAALRFYADPGTYHAVAFMFDRPCGGFDEDFDHDEEYGREMPGKTARTALAAHDAPEGE